MCTSTSVPDLTARYTAGDFQISSDSLHTAGGPTDQWEGSGSGRPANRKPGLVAAAYVAVENSVTLLIGVRMGGGRMAGQDRSMLGGMKALILVKPTIPSSQSTSHVVCLQQLFSNGTWIKDIHLVRWGVMAHVFDHSPCLDRNPWSSLQTNQYCSIKSRLWWTVGWLMSCSPSATRPTSLSRRCRWKLPGSESASASHMRKNL